jgi:hypothetical protein
MHENLLQNLRGADRYFDREVLDDFQQRPQSADLVERQLVDRIAHVQLLRPGCLRSPYP